MAKIKIGIFVGSLRKESLTRQIAKNLITMLPEKHDARLINLSVLEMYNQDFDDEGKTPEAWSTFREEVKMMDGLLFLTPEYNRSVPAVLKNALDIGSRPYGQNAWDGKPAAIISVSIGALGGFGANHHLRQSLVFLNIPVMQQPEAYLGDISNMLDKDGKVTSDFLQDKLKTVAEEYAIWIERFLAK